MYEIKIYKRLPNGQFSLRGTEWRAKLSEVRAELKEIGAEKIYVDINKLLGKHVYERAQVYKYKSFLFIYTYYKNKTNGVLQTPTD